MFKKDRDRVTCLLRADSLNEREICPGISTVTEINYKWSEHYLSPLCGIDNGSESDSVIRW